jgi:histidyl-tRNA synthetase
MGIRAVRGFNDILGGQAASFRHIEDEARRLFTTYGYSEIRIPVVEKTPLFTRSIGETTDIVEKEMYTFPDRRGDSLSLRPEGTASVVRAYIEHKLYNASPVTKLYYTGPMFRYERPQKGRYRQFYQIGAEVLGDDSPGVDAEAIEMLMNYFARLGLDGARLEINSLGCSRGECRPAYKEKLKGFLQGVKDDLCENCLRRVGENPLRALDCKSTGCVEATKDAPAILDSVCRGCKEHFDRVKSYLDHMDVPAVVNDRMVRGLDYYTRTTFEVTAPGLGSQNAVAAGGRYDGLVEDLGGPATPCFGFAVGMERVALLVKEKAEEPLIVLIAMGDEAERQSYGIIKGFREKGLRVSVDYGESKLKGRMKRADRSGARYALIIGEDEVKDKVVTLKVMATGEQERLSPQAALESVLEKIAGEGGQE